MLLVEKKVVKAYDASCGMLKRDRVIKRRQLLLISDQHDEDQSLYSPSLRHNIETPSGGCSSVLVCGSALAKDPEDEAKVARLKWY